MNRFTFSEAQDASAAMTEINQHLSPKFIAGGTNLLDLVKIDVERPDHLIDINRLPFRAIEENGSGGLRLGALVTNADTAWHEQVQSRYPVLSKAILAGASPQLRNMATNGGNLFQRTRCEYFYDTATPCNKREPGSGCSAIGGYTRNMAILGTSEYCIATYPSDMAVALAVLEAVVNVSSTQGEKQVHFADFHRLPGDEPHRDNNLESGDLVTSIDLPAKSFAANHAYLKIRDRASYAFALVSVAVVLELENNVIKEARFALGGVAHKPWRNPAAESILNGKQPSADLFKQAAELALEGAKGYGDNDFKIELAKRAIVRALTEAAKQEEAYGN